MRSSAALPVAPPPALHRAWPQYSIASPSCGPDLLGTRRQLAFAYRAPRKMGSVEWISRPARPAACLRCQGRSGGDALHGVRGGRVRLRRGRLHTDECIVPFQPPHPAAAGLATLAAEGGTIDEADAICRAWLGLGSVNASGRGRDARIVRALQVLQSAIDRPVRLQSLANQLNVSPSWLSHRFVEETGVPLRRYVVWTRLRRAVESVLQGASWTEAAHAVGFSDSAHLSRSFRDNFGIAPSSLIGRRDQISVCFDKG